MIQLNEWGTHYGFFDRYVCISCGFIEAYANFDLPGWQKWIEKMEKENKLDSDFV